MTPEPPVAVAVAAFPGLMALSASMDLLTMTIPNAIPLALAVGYLVVAALLGLPFATVAFGLGCGLATLAVGFAMFRRNWIGGGDAKLAAAIALWLGWGAMLDYAVDASLCGGVLTFVVLAARVKPLPAALARRKWIARLASPGAGVPYGIALAAAGMLLFPHSPVWQAVAA